MYNGLNLSERSIPMTDPRAMAFVNLYGILAALENLCALDETAKAILKTVKQPTSLCFEVKGALRHPAF